MALSDRGLVVRGDATRLMQVPDNLLANALKYSAEDRPIGVSAAEGSSARLKVSDHGPGIAPEHQGELFQRFCRVPDVWVRSGSGLDLVLDLHITRTIVGRHDGQVWVESAPGRGSTFHVRQLLAGAAPLD